MRGTHLAAIASLIVILAAGHVTGTLYTLACTGTCDWTAPASWNPAGVPGSNCSAEVLDSVSASPVSMTILSVNSTAEPLCLASLTLGAALSSLQILGSSVSVSGLLGIAYPAASIELVGFAPQLSIGGLLSYAVAPAPTPTSSSSASSALETDFTALINSSSSGTLELAAASLAANVVVRVQATLVVTSGVLLDQGAALQLGAFGSLQLGPSASVSCVEFGCPGSSALRLEGLSSLFPHAGAAISAPVALTGQSLILNLQPSLASNLTTNVVTLDSLVADFAGDSAFPIPISLAFTALRLVGSMELRVSHIYVYGASSVSLGSLFVSVNSTLSVSTGAPLTWTFAEPADLGSQVLSLAGSLKASSAVLFDCPASVSASLEEGSRVDLLTAEPAWFAETIAVVATCALLEGSTGVALFGGPLAFEGSAAGACNTTVSIDQLAIAQATVAPLAVLKLAGLRALTPLGGNISATGELIVDGLVLVENAGGSAALVSSVSWLGAGRVVLGAGAGLLLQPSASAIATPISISATFSLGQGAELMLGPLASLVAGGLDVSGMLAFAPATTLVVAAPLQATLVTLAGALTLQFAGPPMMPVQLGALVCNAAASPALVIELNTFDGWTPIAVVEATLAGSVTLVLSGAAAAAQGSYTIASFETMAGSFSSALAQGAPGTLTISGGKLVYSNAASSRARGLSKAAIGAIVAAAVVLVAGAVLAAVVVARRTGSRSLYRSINE